MGLFPRRFGGLADLPGKIHVEAFTWVTDLKLRGAYGLAGNNRIAPFQYLTTFGTTSQDALRAEPEPDHHLRLQGNLSQSRI